ncbi:hypothetical protein ACFE04_026248 [Oxalis oulophora]
MTSRKPSLSREAFDSNSRWTPSDMDDLANNLFPENNSSPHDHDDESDDEDTPSAPPQAMEELLITIPGSILHLIDKSCSVWLACGDFSIIRILQGQNVVAVVACVGDDIQWPLTKDGAAVKVDHSHYFFSIHITETPKSKKPKSKSTKSNSSSSSSSSDDEDGDDSDMLNYGLTIASKGQEEKLKELDVVLTNYSSFSVQKVSDKVKEKDKLLDGELEMDMAPDDLNKEMQERSAAFWTTLAPNVEDYSGVAAKLIAAGSGQLIKGILWCGDVTVERMKWGNEVLKQRMIKGDADAEISPEALLRIKRVRNMTKMTEKVATGVLSGVIKVSGFFTSSVTNSAVGKKLGSILPAEVVLASLDGFNKVFDAFEVAGRNVMSTSNVVTTELVTHKYGEKAGEAANEGMNAAGYAVGTAWTAFKIRKVFDPKSAFRPSNVAKKAIKAAEADDKSKNKSKK